MDQFRWDSPIRRGSAVEGVTQLPKDAQLPRPASEGGLYDGHLNRNIRVPPPNPEAHITTRDPSATASDTPY